VSEYLNKKAVLEWHKERIEHWKQFRKMFKDGSHSLNETCEVRIDTHLVAIGLIQSGAFDAEQMKNFEDFLQNYEDFQRKYEHYQTEIQRLREALDFVRTGILNAYEFGYLKETDDGDVKKILDRIDEALSTTTEPSAPERVREYYRKLEELRNRTKYRDAAIEYEQRMTDICNVLDLLGITVPGINATEKGGIPFENKSSHMSK
jgi:hypothetical protein